MKSGAIAGIVFFLLSISFASACSNPIIRSDTGSPVNPFGGFMTVNGSKYTGLSINYNLKVENRNSQGMTVTLREGTYLKDYVNFESVYVPANSQVIMPTQIWVGGQSYYDRIDVFFTCDDGGPQFFHPYFYLFIYGQQIEAPPLSTCDTSNLNGCYSGVLRTYYCSNDDQLTYKSSCTKYCCESFGGEGSFCTGDKQTCVSFNDLPIGTEGNIALLCGKKDCQDGIEKDIRFLLRYVGWNVTAKIYDSWTESELNNYDIILCTDQSKGCNIKFNSPIYNAHVNGKPLLEIPDSKSATAAYSLSYLSNKRGTKGTGILTIPSFDYLTQGFSNPFNAVGNLDVSAITNSLFNLKVKDVADSASSASTIFKSKEDYGHGRFAYLGLFYKAGISDLTTDGQILLNRTLKWLKYGDSYFGGTNFNEPKKGKIAFVCAKDDCKDRSEISTIKFLRDSGYVVDGKSESSWNSEINNYDLIVCSDGSKGCKITYSSLVYNAHSLYGKGFLEISDSTKINSGYTFGYVSKSTGSRKSSISISENTENKIFDGFTSPVTVSIKKRSLSGIKIENLQSVSDIARIVTLSRGIPTVQDISTMFTSNSFSTRGRYAYVGWIPSFDLVSEDGKQLLLRTVQWVKCGDSCL